VEYNQGVLLYVGDVLLDRFECPFGQLVPQRLFKKRHRKSEDHRNLFAFAGVLQLDESLGLNATKTRVKEGGKLRAVLEELGGWLRGLQRGTEADLGSLHDLRFSLNREGTRRHRKE
jgi:hypothetical protein